jgi:hypothetical protein
MLATNTLAAGRITARLHRFELVVFIALAVLGVLATILVAAELDAVGYTATCVDAMRTGAPTPPDCEFKINEFYGIVSGRGWIVTGLTGFVPLAAALLLGVAVVGRELDRGTTRLAWALTPSRMRWLAQRLVPVLLVVTLVGLALGAAADRWLAAAEPGIDPANAFAAFGNRGPVLAARGVFVFALAVAIGALLGRALPALIVAVIVATVGIAGGTQVHQRILRSEAVPIDEARMSAGDLWMDQRFRLPDGTLIGWEDVERYDPPPAEFTEDTVWPTLPQVTFGIPGERYGEVALREIGVLVGGSVVALAATAAIVLRRRPG